MTTNKIKLIFLSFIISSNVSFGQIGINTTNPRSTLDILAGDEAAPGIIAPQQSRQQLTDKSSLYSIGQNGAIVYVNEITGSFNSKTENIGNIGYYYFDENVWKPFSASNNTNEENWSIEGNDNISATRGENYLGTTNATDLILKTNAIEQMTISSAGNVGIGTSNPSNKLHIKSSSSPLQVEGLQANNSQSSQPIVGTPDGVLKLGNFPVINIVPSDIGTVIAIDGKLLVAQEIQVLMDQDFVFGAMGVAATPIPIGNLSNKIIDTSNSLISTANYNSFTVNADGVYSITINAQILTEKGSTPYIGLWNNAESTWVAVTDIIIVQNVQDNLKTLKLSTAVSLNKDITYSFRMYNTAAGTIPWSSHGSTGTGPISYYSVKRLK